MSSDHATPSSRVIMALHSAPSLVRLAAIALGVALTMSTIAHAQLDPTTGVVISQGETDPHFALNSNPETNDRLGYSLAAGDFDGDGTLDLVIGAPYDSRAATYAGSVHLVYGSQSGLDLTTNVVWTLNITLGGPAAVANDDFGWSLAAGDFDGDLYDDLAIGIPGRTVDGDSDAGAALALYGSDSGIQVGGPGCCSRASTGSPVPRRRTPASAPRWPPVTPTATVPMSCWSARRTRMSAASSPPGRSTCYTAPPCRVCRPPAT